MGREASEMSVSPAQKREAAASAGDTHLCPDARRYARESLGERLRYRKDRARSIDDHGAPQTCAFRATRYRYQSKSQGHGQKGRGGPPH